MKIELYRTASELKRLFRKEKDPRLASRIISVYLGLMDKTAPEIATLLGYSYVSSRPEHPKGDPQARETFKKKSVIRSGNSVLIILE